MYEMTTQIAALQPPDPRMVQLVTAMQGNQEAMDAFARVNAGVTPIPEFFASEHLGKIFGSATARK
jgi:hypothetical protein